MNTHGLSPLKMFCSVSALVFLGLTAVPPAKAQGASLLNIEILPGGDNVLLSWPATFGSAFLKRTPIYPTLWDGRPGRPLPFSPKADSIWICRLVNRPSFFD